MRWDRARLLAGKIAKICTACVIVSPILMGFFFPWTFYVSEEFIFPVGFSWLLADPTLLWREPSSSWLAASWFPLGRPTLFALEVALFTVGLWLFCISLMALVPGLRSKSRLVREGPYRYIRHPQYLGLILIFLSLSFYNPVTVGYGVRLGDLVSWVQFVFLMVAFSDWEDFHLRKKFPDTYLEYYAKTGFLLPRIFPSKDLGYFSVFRHPKARYVLFIVLYVLIVAGLYVLCLIGLAWWVF